jgi:hypothetical protein
MEGVAKNLRSHDEGAVARGISFARSALIWTSRPTHKARPEVRLPKRPTRLSGHLAT